MKKIKKIFAGLMAVASLAVGMTGMSASASTTDYKINNFTIKALSYTQVGAPRLKEDKTSVYCYITKAGNSVKAQAWGANKNDLIENCTLNRNAKSVTYVNLKIGTEYQIYNSIKENGYAYAGLKLKSDNLLNDDIVSGFWSADSTGTANMPVANN